ncbi:MAG: hypothetical protein AB8B50_06155 [Pirellulaceae bacterium]
MLFRTKLSLAAILLTCGLAGSANAQEFVVGNGPQLFANQYTQGMANQATAQMYVAPVPVPPWVGHTYYTYQPFYPHEMMYGHSRRYHNYYDNGNGMNRTRVHYSTAPVQTAVRGMFKGISLPRW